jgi:hypothetical protein
MAGKRYEKVDLFAVKLVGLTISMVSVAFAQNLSVGGAAGANLDSNFGALPIASGLAYRRSEGFDRRLREERDRGRRAWGWRLRLDD